MTAASLFSKINDDMNERNKSDCYIYWLWEVLCSAVDNFTKMVEIIVKGYR